MKWQFNTNDGRKAVTFNAEVICTTLQIEQIKVTGSGISIVLQNNRPLLEAIELKQPLTWRQVDGDAKDQALVGSIKKELENHLKKVPVKPVEAAKKQGKAAVAA